MNSDQELAKFRNEWKDELTTTQTEESKVQHASSLYLKGSELERTGYCFEAIEYYRRALKLVPDIEDKIEFSVYNEQDVQGATSSDTLDFYQDETLLLPDEEELGVEQRGPWFDEVNCCEPYKPPKGAHISCLPDEILLTVFRYVVSTELDMRSIEMLSRVCKLFYQIAHGSDLWRSACKRVWPEAPLKGYGTWRDMWIRRPHLRFDGIYISRVKYYREGEVQPSLCCSLHTVIYHRFFRFFPDGLVLGLNTPSPPQQSVASLRDRISTNKDVLYGSYTVNGDTIELTLLKRVNTGSTTVQLDQDKSSHIVLNLTNKSGKQSLQWIDYYNINRDRYDGTVNKSEIQCEPPHFCRFVFGRVKSYTAVSAGKI